MRVLVTGGAGFIGSHLCDRLLSQGNEVTVIDDFSTGQPANVETHLKNPNFTIHHAGIAEGELLRRICRESQMVYHFAGAAGVSYVINNPIEAIRRTVLISEILLRTIAENPVPIFIASSSEVYGKSIRVPFDEDDDSVLGTSSQQRWCYAHGKSTVEHLALAYKEEKGLPVVIGRLFNTIGPRQSGRYGMVVPRFLEQARSGKALTVYGDGEQTRCFADVDEVVAALMVLMANSDAFGQVVNIGTDQETSINRLATIIGDLFDKGSSIEHIAVDEIYSKPYEETRRRIPKLSKLARLAGFIPSHPVESILDRLVERNQYRDGAAV